MDKEEAALLAALEEAKGTLPDSDDPERALAEIAAHHDQPLPRLRTRFMRLIQPKSLTDWAAEARKTLEQARADREAEARAVIKEATASLVNRALSLAERRRRWAEAGEKVDALLNR